MDKQPSTKSRHAAAQAFINSLDELESVLQAEETETAAQASIPQISQTSPPAQSSLDSLLADALQDIEQFMADARQAKD